MSSFGTTLAAVVRKEVLQTTRDRRVYFLLLVAPVIQVVLFGYAANMAFLHADVVVVDQDHSPESRDFAAGLAAEGTFRTRHAGSTDAAEARLRAGEAELCVVLPRGFGRRVHARERAEVQVLLDGSDSSKAVQAAHAVELYAASRSPPPALLEPIPRPTLVPRLLYNPALEGRVFMVPGTAASILIIITTVVTAMGFAREREMGTLEQLLVTPIDPLVLMVGKILPYALFGLVDACLILVAGNLLFDVPMRGSIGVVFLGVSLYLVTTLGIGLAISTLARNQQQALMAGFFFLLPAMLLSGFMTPIDAMPWWIRPITVANPLRWFLELWRTVLLRGGGLDDVLAQLLALTILGALVMGLAAARFRRSLG